MAQVAKVPQLVEDLNKCETEEEWLMIQSQSRSTEIIYICIPKILMNHLLFVTLQEQRRDQET